MGIRRVASLAPSAFLASAASTHDLQEHILARSGTHSDDSLSTVRTLWTTTTNLPCPNLPSAAKQTSWDKPYINHDKAAVLDSAPDSHHRARLLAVAAPHAGDWLHALPQGSSCGLRLDDEAIRVAVGLRLGLNICQPHPFLCGTHKSMLAARTAFRANSALAAWRVITISTT